MYVYGELKNADLHNLGADPAAGIIGRIYYNTASTKVMVDDGTHIYAMLRNDGKAIIGNSGTASTNIRFHRGGTSILQFVTADDVTAEGSLSTSLASIQAKQYTSTIATGTAPFVVASTTLVSNLYVARAVVADNAGVTSVFGRTGAISATSGDYSVSQVSGAAPIADPQFTGTVVIPTPFTLGAISVTTTATKLNLLTSAASSTGNNATNLVFSGSPTIATPTITTSATVPLIIGGTGTSSSLILQSTSGTGGSTDLIKFLVGNNGATQAMMINGNGTVGIGMTAVRTLDVTGTFGATGASVFGSTVSATQYTSTVATGTAPFVVASTTNVANLNASSLSGATFAAPGAIGGGTPSTGAFTTVSGTVFTSTVAIGTAPLVVTSTTQVPNLYVARSVLSDTSTLSTVASSVTTAADTSTNANFFLTFVTSSSSGNQAAFMSSGLKFNPSTNTLTTTAISATGTLGVSGTTTAAAINASGVITLSRAASSGVTLDLNGVTAVSPSTQAIRIIANTGGGYGGGIAAGLDGSGNEIMYLQTWNAGSAVTRLTINNAGLATFANAATVTGVFTASSTTNLITGNATGAIGAGIIGEIISSNSSANPTNITSYTLGQVGSISLALTAGTWNIHAVVNYFIFGITTGAGAAPYCSQPLYEIYNSTDSTSLAKQYGNIVTSDGLTSGPKVAMGNLAIKATLQITGNKTVQLRGALSGQAIGTCTAGNNGTLSTNNNALTNGITFYAVRVG